MDRYVSEKIKLFDHNKVQVVEDDVSLLELRTFPRSFWILCMSCVLVYGCVIPFNSIASALIIEQFLCFGSCCPNADARCDKQIASENQASLVMGIPYVIFAVLAPIMGFLVDKFGGNIVLIIVSSATLIAVHISIALSSQFGVLCAALVLQGLTYAVYAASIWPTLPHIVKAHQVGTAYGVAFSIQNLGLAIIPLVVAALRNASGKYVSVEIFFASMGAVGVIISLLLQYFDIEDNNKMLNMSAEERAAYKRAKEEGSADQQAVAERQQTESLLHDVDNQAENKEDDLSGMDSSSSSVRRKYNEKPV
jgi:MFS family permease